MQITLSVLALVIAAGHLVARDAAMSSIGLFSESVLYRLATKLRISN